MKFKFQQGTTGRHAYLLALVPPLLVFFTAGLLFECTVDPAWALVDQVRNEIANQSRPTPIAIFKEAKARYLWFALALLDIVVPVIAGLISARIVLRSAAGDQRVILGTVGVGLAAAFLAYTFLWGNALQQMIFGYTYRTLADSGRFSLAFLANVSHILVLINVIAAVTPAIMLVGACSTACPVETDEADMPAYWGTQMDRLRDIVNAGSAYLVFGTLHMGAWLSWPAALAQDEALQESLEDLAHGITLYWGVTFTLLVIAAYAPAAYYLHLRAKKAVTEQREALGIADVETWLKEHKLSIRLANHLPQLIIMLTPFFAGPLSSMLSGIGAL